jgi:hypothetical protein
VKLELTSRKALAVEANSGFRKLARSKDSPEPHVAAASTSESSIRRAATPGLVTKPPHQIASQRPPSQSVFDLRRTLPKEPQSTATHSQEASRDVETPPALLAEASAPSGHSTALEIERSLRGRGPEKGNGTERDRGDSNRMRGGKKSSRYFVR